MILTRRSSQKWLNFEKIRETRAESAPSSLRELDRDFSLPRRSPKFWTKEDDSDDAPIRAIFPLLSFESLFLTMKQKKVSDCVKWRAKEDVDPGGREGRQKRSGKAENFPPNWNCFPQKWTQSWLCLRVRRNDSCFNGQKSYTMRAAKCSNL